MSCTLAYNPSPSLCDVPPGKDWPFKFAYGFILIHTRELSPRVSFHTALAERFPVAFCLFEGFSNDLLGQVYPWTSPNEEDSESLLMCLIIPNRLPQMALGWIVSKMERWNEWLVISRLIFLNFCSVLKTHIQIEETEMFEKRNNNQPVMLPTHTEAQNAITGWWIKPAHRPCFRSKQPGGLERKISRPGENSTCCSPSCLAPMQWGLGARQQRTTRHMLL